MSSGSEKVATVFLYGFPFAEFVEMCSQIRVFGSLPELMRSFHDRTLSVLMPMAIQYCIGSAYSDFFSFFADESVNHYSYILHLILHLHYNPVNVFLIIFSEYN